MHPTTRFRLTPGAVLLGLAAIAACGRKDEQAPPPRLIAPGVAAAEPQPAPPEVTGDQPGLPKLNIQADAMATAGTTGHRAQVFGEPGLQYQWFIEGGSFEGDTRGESVAWTAGPPGEIRIYCQGTNAAGKKTVMFVRATSEAAPVIERFAAYPPVLTAGHAAKLSWSAQEVKTLTLDPGGQDVTQMKGTGLEVKPPETATYTLTATNAAGTSVAKAVQLKVVPPPAIRAFTVIGAVNFGQALTLSGAFSGGKAELKQGGTVLASADGGSIQAQVPALKAGDSFSLTVTNEAGDSVTRNLAFNPPGQP